MKRLIAAGLLAGATCQAFALTLPPLPVARNDLFELTGLTLNVSTPGLLANDSGTDISVSGFLNPGSGVINRIVTDGSFLYTPALGFAGTTSFQYTIADSYGRGASAIVTIDASTTLPRAQDDYYTLRSTTLDIAAPGLLANDRGGIGALSVSGFANPDSGAINRIVTDGSFRYTPERGFAGVASFAYTLQDELGRGARATVFIDAGATIPVAIDDTYFVTSGELLDISAPGLLANDRGGIGEVFVSGFVDPEHGTVERIVTDGSLRFRSDPGFVGTTSFLYTSEDELGRGSRALVTLNVLAAVPEPGTWWMLLGGLGLLGFSGACGASRRRPG